MTAQFDAGLWSCSVSATTYLGRLYLRDTLDSPPALLTVLHPPSHAAVRARGDISGLGQVVGVAGTQLHVECLAYGGAPPPSIVWHVAGALQAEEAAELDTFTDMETALDVTRSTLRLEVTSADHGKVVSCEVAHPALELPLWVKSMLNVGCMYASSSTLCGASVGTLFLCPLNMQKNLDEKISRNPQKY